MASDLYQLVQDELKPGEKLVWHGLCQSRRGKQDKAAGPYFWIGLCCFVGILLAAAARGPQYLIVTLPLGLIVGFWIAGKSPSSNYRKKQTVYALTDRRVFAIRDLFRRRQIRSLPLQYISAISLGDQKLDNRGTITFSVPSPRHAGAPLPYMRFFMIGDLQHVHKLAVSASASARNPGEVVAAQAGAA